MKDLITIIPALIFMFALGCLISMLGMLAIGDTEMRGHLRHGGKVGVTGTPFTPSAPGLK